jgi:SAM-dependent methyltransferase
MRYDWNVSLGRQEFSLEFFEEVDRRFFGSAEEYAPHSRVPFDSLIDYEWLGAKRVLEIGVGNGSHAQLLARHAKAFTGIDLTQYAVRSTQARLRQRGLPGNVLRMDAEQMAFRDASFDFVWSWGVIHHSSDTRRALAEVRRVLKPGGKATIMVYHRGWWSYYAVGGLFAGVLRGDLFRTGSLHRTTQQLTDGALAPYYSLQEWRDLVGELLEVERLFVLGPKSDLVPLPAGRLKNLVMSMIPRGVSRFLTRGLRMGSFLVSTATKRVEPPN